MQKKLASLAFLAATIVAATAAEARAADIESASRIAFGPANVLFLADWKAARLDAFELPPLPPGHAAPFNMLDLAAPLQAVLGTSDVRVNAIAKRPDSDEVYLAVSAGPDETPAVLVVTPEGSLRKLDLSALRASSIGIEDAPTGDFKFWGRTPARSYTVTDMKWHNGRLFVAGLANQSFSSSLRVIPYPFKGGQSVSYVEMYHTTHNQMETRAPIREMSFADIGGQDTMIAAYLCTPLVTIPVNALRNGAHVMGKTIAELGYGNYPNGMVSFTAGEPGKQVHYILITNAYRSATLIPLDDIAQAAGQSGLAKPVPFGAVAGASGHELPLGGVMAVDNLDDRYLVVVRPDPENAHLELVTFDKRFNFRVSDFVSEYDFPGYKYAAPFEAKNIEPVVETLAKEEGVSDHVQR